MATYVWWLDPKNRAEMIMRGWVNPLSPAEKQWRRDMWEFYRERERLESAGFWTDQLGIQWRIVKEPEFPK